MDSPFVYIPFAGLCGFAFGVLLNLDNLGSIARNQKLRVELIMAVLISLALTGLSCAIGSILGFVATVVSYFALRFDFDNADSTFRIISFLLTLSFSCSLTWFVISVLKKKYMRLISPAS